MDRPVVSLDYPILTRLSQLVKCDLNEDKDVMLGQYNGLHLDVDPT